MLRIFLTVLVATVLTASSAHALFGRTQHVRNIQDMPVRASNGNELTEDQVHDAIFVGAMAKGWQAEDVEPGHITAKIHVRTHMAEVDIPYTADTYSIIYKNSDNLLYDGTHIHRNYNRWVQYLSKSINAELRRY